MKYLAGIHIGGRNIEVGVVSCEGDAEILEEASIPGRADEAPDQIVGRIAEATRALIAKCNVTVAGVGVGCPGLFEPETGRLLKSPNMPHLAGFPLRSELSRLLRLPVEVQNDANAAVLGELLFGPSKGARNLILLTLGTGVGGGAIVDGRLLQGADNAAAQLGHLCVEPGGAGCGCGKRGCMEAYVGAAGILRIAKRRLSSAKESRLSGDSLSTEAVAEAAQAGDKVAREILHKVGEYLGRGIALLIDTLNPEKVLLGGCASAAIEWLRPGMTAAVNENASFAETRDRTVIEQAAFPDDTNILGAAATFLNAQSQTIQESAVVRRVRLQPAQQHNHKADYVLGVHIGASSWHIGILCVSGEVIAYHESHEPLKVRQEKPYDELMEDTLDAMARVVAEAEKKGIPKNRLLGGGVVVPAPVNAKQARVAMPPALPGLQDRDLGRDLRDRFAETTGLRLPFWVENDANGACLTERYFGEGRDGRDYVTIILSTGLGSAMMFDGKLHRGHNHMAGEVGHITVQPNGMQCKCGSKGCLETVASGAALLRSARECSLSLRANDRLHYVDLVRAAGNGDKAIDRLFTTMGQYLGIGIASIVNVLNPSRVILTGELAKASEFFMPSTRRELRNRVFAGMECELGISDLLERSEVRAGLSTFLHYHEPKE